MLTLGLEEELWGRNVDSEATLRPLPNDVTLLTPQVHGLDYVTSRSTAIQQKKERFNNKSEKPRTNNSCISLLRMFYSVP